MIADDILDGILEREGEGTPPYLAPGDAGGRTTWGISERAHPEAWLRGPPTKAEARAIYEVHYIAPFRVADRTGIDSRLREALIDDAVMSGAPAAIMRWQTVLGVTVDGVIGPATLAAACARSQPALLTAYVVARALSLTRLVQRRPADLVNLTGWISRVLGFLP